MVRTRRVKLYSHPSLLNIVFIMANNRNVIFANGEIYHILNRSIAQEEIFTKKNQLNRILNLLQFYRYLQNIKYSEFKKLSVDAKKNYIDNSKNEKPLVEIYSFSIMPNHFHLLLKQISDNGIVRFTSNFQNSYAKYFNKTTNRDGSLFKRPFRAVHIDNDETFLHVLRYIHLNPVTSFIVEFRDLASYPWNSYSHYLLSQEYSFIEKGVAIKMFEENIDKFVEFTSNQEDYQKKLAGIKHFSLE